MSLVDILSSLFIYNNDAIENNNEGIENKNEEALELYLKAEKINPDDTIVLSNIGLIYERLSDKKNAVKYYQKIEKVGDEQAKEMARKKINDLK